MQARLQVLMREQQEIDPPKQENQNRSGSDSDDEPQGFGIALPRHVLVARGQAEDAPTVSKASPLPASKSGPSDTKILFQGREPTPIQPSETFNWLDDPEALLRELGISRHGETKIGRSRLLPKQEIIQLFPAHLTKEIELERSIHKQLKQAKSLLQYFRRIASAKGSKRSDKNVLKTAAPESETNLKTKDNQRTNTSVKGSTVSQSVVTKQKPKAAIKLKGKGEDSSPARDVIDTQRAKVRFREDDARNGQEDQGKTVDDVEDGDISVGELDDGDISPDEDQLSEEEQRIKTIHEIASDFEEEFKGERSVVEKPDELLQTLASLKSKIASTGRLPAFNEPKLTSALSLGSSTRIKTTAVPKIQQHRVIASNILKQQPLKPLQPFQRIANLPKAPTGPSPTVGNNELASKVKSFKHALGTLRVRQLGPHT